MLPKELIGPHTRYRGPQDPEWLEYLSRIGDYAVTVDHEFLAEICFEHGRLFNAYFPRFNLKRHSVARRTVTASEVRDNVRFYDDEHTPCFKHIFDDFRKGRGLARNRLCEDMVKQRTWPFPPVVIDNETGFGENLSPKRLGYPWHLIEGCHRVSYLKHMLDLGMVKPDSEHEIFWLSAKPLPLG